MKLRVLAAAAVAAWSKTAAATTATVLPGVLDQPAGASVSSSASAATARTDVFFNGPRDSGLVPPVDVSVRFKGASGCFPGTLSLQASMDQTHWKTLASQHTEMNDVSVDHTCLSGTWSYRGFYVTDDHAFKGTITPQEQFTC